MVKESAKKDQEALTKDDQNDGFFSENLKGILKNQQKISSIIDEIHLEHNT